MNPNPKWLVSSKEEEIWTHSKGFPTPYPPRDDHAHREEASICTPRREDSEGANPPTHDSRPERNYIFKKKFCLFI